MADVKSKSVAHLVPGNELNQVIYNVYIFILLVRVVQIYAKQKKPLCLKSSRSINEQWLWAQDFNCVINDKAAAQVNYHA